jgi:hypothetical protein
MKNNKGKMRSQRKTGRQSETGFFPPNGEGDIIRKRLTISGPVLATGAGTVIPVTSFTSTGVQGIPATEWASFSSRYQQFRVRAIRVTGTATNPVETATITHGSLFRGDYLGVQVPATALQVLSDERVKVSPTHQSFCDTVTWKNNPNAQLWNPTSAGIPAANQFSWVAASATLPALLTATTYYGITVEWDVEFRGSQ